MTIQVEEKAAFPVQAHKNDEDLLPPIQALLRGMQVLPNAGDVQGPGGTFLGPPDSVAVLEAGASSFSKWWALAVGALGGTAAIGTAVTRFWDGQPTSIRASLVASAAFVVAATVIAIAIVVSSDVRARGQAQMAVYAAREAVAVAFLQAASSQQVFNGVRQPQLKISETIDLVNAGDGGGGS